MTIKPLMRDLTGLLLLDKPLHLTSNAALQICKRLFRANKAGHTGSLDPLATGMLPLCFGRTTKLAQYWLDADKTYEFTVKLGSITTTGDAAGEVISESPVPVLSSTLLIDVLAQFRGELTQIPPMYSALKVQGRPLYQLARQGVEVERAARPITIYENHLLGFDDLHVHLRMRVSKGTYIRTIAEDIGRMLGCGGHVAALRRLSVSGFLSERMVPMSVLETAENLDAYLYPLALAFSHYPHWVCTAPEIALLHQGRLILVNGIKQKSGHIALLDADKQFVGLGELKGRVVEPRCMI